MVDLLQNIDSVVPTIGYTLFHSLWQGLLIYCSLFLIFTIFRVSSSRMRYTLSVSALSVYLISSTITFFWLYNPITQSGIGTSGIQILFYNELVAANDFSFSTWLSQNMGIILMVWSTGVLMMTLRLLGGWYVLTRIKKSALECTNEVWLYKLEVLKSRLSIATNIALKISSRVDVPMVFGTIKPIIILPTTLLTGLSEEQLEIILAHELAHVKRYDFVINILQHFVEVVFFFNPFVWLISNAIRTERENACDDLALSVSGDSYSLASTLLRVEEIRRQPQLALHFSNNNNIFHRIKRLTGMKTQNLFDARMVTLVLFAASLMSFGWYSMNAKVQQENTTSSKVEFNEQPKVDVKVEVDPKVDAQSIAMVSQEPATKVDVKEESAPMLQPVVVAIDTTEKDKDDWRYEERIPPLPPLPPVTPRVMDEWTEAFAEKFAEQFEDFYAEHQEEMEEMMAELQETMESADFEELRDFKHAKEMALRQKEMALARSEEWRLDESKIREEAERSMVLAKRAMETQRVNMREMREEMVKMEREMRVFEQKMKKFNEELTDELVKDGYIKSSESIEMLDVDRDGQFKVNGKKVSEKDSKKYGELYEKYFDEQVKGLRYNN